MIGCLRTRVRKQPIIALYLSLRMNSSFITSRPCVLFIGQRQTLQTKFRRHRRRCLIRVSTVCLQVVLSKFDEKKNLSPNNYKNWKLTHQLVRNKNPIGLGDTDLRLSTTRDFSPHINNLLDGFQDNHSISNQRPCHNMHICHKHTRAHQSPKNLD